jgi:exosortase A-associated hydrolase 1
LWGTLDPAPGTSGLLIVSGGNEIRSGAWAGQALLAARLAAAGHPVFRFDRRGIGDSEGENRGFRGSCEDIACATAAFREACPGLGRVVAFGNCDAASALMLFGHRLKFDALLLANPWVLDRADDAAFAPAALRRRLRKKLLDPNEWTRYLKGGLSFTSALAALREAISPPQPASSLAEDMKRGLDAFGGPAVILLASLDRTAELFTAAWPRGDERVRSVASASHSFSDAVAREWLVDQVLEALG